MRIVQKESQQRWLVTVDLLGMGLLGVFCFLYSVSTSNFAEQHLSFSWLSFPVFVGEILMFLCCILVVLKWALSGVMLNRWFVLTGCYLSVVVVIALIEFKTYGALAFRNAALFYYPVFALISFYFFNQNIIKQFKYVLVISLGVLVGLKCFEGYYWLSYVVLFIACLLSIRQRWVWISGVLYILFLGHVDSLFRESRSNLVANMAASLFSVVLCIRFYLNNIFLRVASALIFIFCLGWGVFFIADKHAVRSLIHTSQWRENYRYYKDYIEENQKVYQPEKLSANFYLDNKKEKIRKQQESQRDTEIFIKKVQIDNQEPPEIKLNQSEEPQVIEVKPLPSENLNESVIHETQTELTLLDNINDYSSDQNISPPSHMPELSNEKDLSPKEDELLKLEDGLTEEKSVNIVVPQSEYRSLSTAYNNIIFRFLIWEDMINELVDHKVFFGVGFGKPQRSPNIEILGWARDEWQRDGWITPHNSFLHLVYRAGVIGLFIVGVIFFIFISITRIFIEKRSVTGILLSTAIIYWMVMANFLLILELPYYAIVFWSIFGLSCRYAYNLKKGF